MPLAIPLLTGPGSISTVIVYAGKSAHWWQSLVLVGLACCWGPWCT